MILTDKDIQKLCEDEGMIDPFIPSSTKVLGNGARVPSFGLSSCGYDIRVDGKFKLFKRDENTVITPSAFTPNIYDFYTVDDYFIIPPGGFVLANTIEKFKMPTDVIGICTGKSTWARCGLDVLVTPLEPGWEGYLTLELVNHTGCQISIPVGCGIAQINFFKGTERPMVGYNSRNGKYMGQGPIPVDPQV